MIINHNMNALNAHRNMGMNTNAAGKSMEKLSSGLRINRAGDDAAGLAISEKMRGQIRGLDQASRNAQDGISLIQTAEGALNETHNILQRMRELAVQSANDTNITEDRAAIQEEMNALTAEIDRISEQTEFNKQTLLDGSFNGTFQIGANSNQTISLGVDAMDASNLGLTSTVTITQTGNLEADHGLTSGEYTIKDGKLLDSTGKSVGTVDGADKKVINLTSGKKLTLSDENAVDGAKITIDAKNNKATSVQKADLTEKGKELAAGNYEINGTIVFKDGKEVGKLNGTNIEITGMKDATGNQVAIGASDLGLSSNLGTGSGKISKFTINGADVSSSEKASGSIETINKAIENVSTQRAKLGAVQNRLEHTTANLNNTSENLTAAESRIRDVDMAKEMMNFSKNNILSQAAQAMLAQANQQPQGVLQLLR